MQMCHDEGGAADVDGAMERAARNGHEAIVRLCHDEWGATDVDALSRKRRPRSHRAVVPRVGHLWWE